ncbi:transglutaminase-like domain-containing protein [Thermococcus thioreducens]|uniref:Predicted transglutaminase-like protease n=1 Tax=Thermococcus thioreducens TaxID=277988 RepID=A0A0Q2UPA4_9EURY|nr:transglutaminase-like domain-containing protein [Thermococcus thioreducens]ASJ12468.1 hypothetical protein A3L14_05995 [Thermococcus thioreducens]KQH82528.1 hypothetical protein AMR53_06255 [Thermococcus thioreducens]SEV90252.1 Predicted transglutaminase-like protease [Thermococcus thioreducens]
MKVRKNPIETSLPTLQDVQYVTAIYQRLSGNSEAETLTNLLEWQERNIQYWKERYWAASGIMIFLIIIIFVLVTLFFSVINVPYLSSLSKKAFLLFGLISILICTFLVVFLCFMLPYNYYNLVAQERQSPPKKLKKMFKLVYHTIKPSLPISIILDYRLAVCRDYAKLTAALLFNSYPEVYFLTLPNHVAVAVMINGKYYVLDQKLPIISLDSWIKRWEWLLWALRLKNKLLLRRYIPECSMYLVQFEKNLNGTILAKPTIREYIRYKVKTYEKDDIRTCIEKLEKLLINKFGLNSVKAISRKPDFTITLKNYGIYCENDEIILYSIARSIRNRIEAELSGGIKKLSGLRIFMKDDQDLLVEVYLKMQK